MRLADLMSLHAKGQKLTHSIYEDLRNNFDDGQILELSMIFALLSGMAHFYLHLKWLKKRTAANYEKVINYSGVIVAVYFVFTHLLFQLMVHRKSIIALLLINHGKKWLLV